MAFACSGGSGTGGSGGGAGAGGGAANGGGSGAGGGGDDGDMAITFTGPYAYTGTCSANVSNNPMLVLPQASVIFSLASDDPDNASTLYVGFGAAPSMGTYTASNTKGLQLNVVRSNSSEIGASDPDGGAPTLNLSFSSVKLLGGGLYEVHGTVDATFESYAMKKADGGYSDATEHVSATF